MKFVFDKKTGQYMPESYLDRVDRSEIEREVFNFLDRNPQTIAKYGYSSARLMQELMRRSPNYDTLMDNQDVVKAAVNEWYFKNQRKADEAFEEAGGACGPAAPAGAPATISALSIPSPVLPDKDKKKKSSTESVQGYKEVPLSEEVVEKYKPYFKLIKPFEPAHSGYILLDGEKPVAVLQVRKDNNKGYQCMRLNTLEVTPEYRGKGLGKELLDIAVTKFGVTELGVAKDNATALNLYESYGFEISEELPWGGYDMVLRTDQNGATEAVYDNYDDIPEEYKQGNCYQTAWQTFYSNIAKKPLLCHGVVVGKGRLDGVKFTHAWVEIGDRVIDETMSISRYGISKEAYYQLGNIDPKLVFKYDSAQVSKKAVEWGTYGPWENILWQYG